MHRKLLGICLALAAFAIIPATASATFLTDTSGGSTTLVKVGSKIKAISEETTIFQAGELRVECNENFITGTVVKNNGSVEVTIEDARFQSNLTNEPTKCKSSLGNITVTIPALTNEGGTKHWCIKNGIANNFNLFGRSCNEEGNGTLTIVFHFSSFSCYYDRSTAISGAFTTPGEHKASTLSVIGAPIFIREPPSNELFCPKELSITTMKFNLFTDTASSAETNVWDDAASTGDPVWASETE